MAIPRGRVLLIDSASLIVEWRCVIAPKAWNGGVPSPLRCPLNHPGLWLSDSTPRLWCPCQYWAGKECYGRPIVLRRGLVLLILVASLMGMVREFLRAAFRYPHPRPTPQMCHHQWHLGSASRTCCFLVWWHGFKTHKMNLNSLLFIL